MQMTINRMDQISFLGKKGSCAALGLVTAWAVQEATLPLRGTGGQSADLGEVHDVGQQVVADSGAVCAFEFGIPESQLSGYVDEMFRRTFEDVQSQTETSRLEELRNTPKMQLTSLDTLRRIISIAIVGHRMGKKDEAQHLIDGLCNATATSTTHSSVNSIMKMCMESYSSFSDSQLVERLLFGTEFSIAVHYLQALSSPSTQIVKFGDGATGKEIYHEGVLALLLWATDNYSRLPGNIVVSISPKGMDVCCIAGTQATRDLVHNTINDQRSRNDKFADAKATSESADAFIKRSVPRQRFQEALATTTSPGSLITLPTSTTTTGAQTGSIGKPVAYSFTSKRRVGTGRGTKDTATCSYGTDFPDVDPDEGPEELATPATPAEPALMSYVSDDPPCTEEEREEIAAYNGPPVVELPSVGVQRPDSVRFASLHQAIAAAQKQAQLEARRTAEEGNRAIANQHYMQLFYIIRAQQAAAATKEASHTSSRRRRR
eukprot:Polyplicarium_translucidae@DN4546_c0_g1_i1.p1